MLCAQYNGDANWEAYGEVYTNDINVAAPATPLAASTTLLTITPGSLGAVLTATVNGPAAATVAPTGFITFLDNGAISYWGSLNQLVPASSGARASFALALSSEAFWARTGPIRLPRFIPAIARICRRPATQPQSASIKVAATLRWWRKTRSLRWRRAARDGRHEPQVDQQFQRLGRSHLCTFVEPILLQRESGIDNAERRSLGGLNDYRFSSRHNCKPVTDAKAKAGLVQRRSCIGILFLVCSAASQAPVD